MKFPIIADPQGFIARKLGMLHAESATHTVRAVFVVDDKGIIRTILYYPLNMGRLSDEPTAGVSSIPYLYNIPAANDIANALYPTSSVTASEYHITYLHINITLLYFLVPLT